MAGRIEDYALIGDCQTAALVGRDGSIDWLCLPRFDSGACFAALLGTPEHGRWRIAPVEPVTQVTRRYLDSTLILETTFTTASGSVAVLDFMPPRTDRPDLVRIVRGKRGHVRMKCEFVLRFNYGSVIPWVRTSDGGILAIAGPDAVQLVSDVPLHGENFKTVAEFDVGADQERTFVLQHFPSHQSLPPVVDPHASLEATQQWWHNWSQHCTYSGPHREPVVRSLVTLSALTYEPTGGITAALTTSLPEEIGGSRNWDYRYCWLRDATFTLYALLEAGFTEEACAWRDWLLRAVAGSPDNVRPLYGLAGERNLFERELPWLPGYEDSRPVRVGNAAADQLQLDVFGEVMDALHLARRKGLPPNEFAWNLQRALAEHLATIWQQPDRGIWEVRGPQQHFTHSKVMAWVAMDRAVKAVERFELAGPVDKWRKLRDQIHDEVCQRGFSRKRNAFTQAYESEHLDASLLLLPLVGFLPASDPRVVGTIDAIEKHLMRSGFVERYDTDTQADGVAGGEGAFLLCTFWFVDNLHLIDRTDEAEEIFDRLLGIRNDVGLLAEEYDPHAQRQLGNFPQAFSHVALVNTAINLCTDDKVSEHRSHG